jgi:hypothetical protein
LCFINVFYSEWKLTSDNNTIIQLHNLIILTIAPSLTIGSTNLEECQGIQLMDSDPFGEKKHKPQSHITLMS